MNRPGVFDVDSVGHARWRMVRGYTVSRRLPGYWLMMLILLGMVVWGGDWGEGHAPTSLQLLVFLLPVATASVIGVSLWSPFGETERAAGTWLPLGRILHLTTMIVLALLVNRVAITFWVPDGDVISWEMYLLRHSVALIGFALIACTVIDTRLSWIGPALVAMPGVVTGYIRVVEAESEGRTVSFFQEDAWHLMLRPDDSVLAWVVAVVLFAAGVAFVVRRGERLAEPEDTAG